MPEIGGVYLPDKGSICLVTGIAVNTDDPTDLVVLFESIYQRMQYTMKLSKFVDGRFEFLYTVDMKGISHAYETLRNEIING